MKYIFIVIGIAAIIGIGTSLLRSGVSSLSMSKNVQKEILPTLTPMPFVEMTIPHLRSRSYVSQMGERRRVDDDVTYMTYTTNYVSDGLKINALLTIPKGDMPLEGWPAIVFVHGYIPPTQYETTSKYVDYIDYLARHGFVVYKIDLRGHGKSEGEAGGGYYSSDYVIDTLNARAALETVDFVNPKRIGLWGHSMAGNTLMRAFAARPEIPAVVIWAGAGYTYTDLAAYRISDASYQSSTTTTPRARLRQMLRDAHGNFTPSSAFWKQVAVTDYLKDLKGAIEIHHAVDDTVVSIEYSRNLVSLLDATNVSHELFEYAGGGHNISGVYFTTAMERTVKLYTKYLK